MEGKIGEVGIKNKIQRKDRMGRVIEKIQNWNIRNQTNDIK